MRYNEKRVTEIVNKDVTFEFDVTEDEFDQLENILIEERGNNRVKAEFVFIFGTKEITIKAYK